MNKQVLTPQVITVLGATGSIGCSTLDVVARHPELFEVFALSGHRQTEQLAKQCAQFVPKYAVVLDEDVAQEAAVRVLVVEAQLVGRQHGDDGLDDAVSAAILNQAVPHGHDAVRPHGVDAADGLARLVH